MWEIGYGKPMRKMLLLSSLIVVIGLGVVGVVLVKNKLNTKDDVVKQEPLILSRNVGMTDVQKKVFLDRINESQKQLSTLEISDKTKIDRFDISRTIANNYFVVGELQLAKEYYAKAAAIADDDASLWFSLASVEVQMRDYSAADNHIEIALKLAPGNAEYWRLKFDIASQFQHFSADRMKSLFDRALASTGGDPDVISYYATYLKNQGDVTGSIEQWKKASEKNPDGKAIYDKEIEELQKSQNK